MIIVERPNDSFYIPMANNFVIRLTENNMRYCEVLINDVNRFVFYPFGNAIYMNLKDNFKSLFLDSYNLMKGFRVKVEIKTFGAGTLPIATQVFNYTLLPFGVNYNEQPTKLQVPTSGFFVASPLKIVRFGNLPITAIKYDVNGTAIFTMADGITVIDRPETCGNYFRYLNKLGGWSYWLFNSGTKTKQTQDLGEIYNDYNNFGNTYAPTIYRGKDSNDVITCNSGMLEDWEQEIVRPILTAPNVEFWNGTKWLSVKVAASNYNTETMKHRNIDFSFIFTFPDDNNISI